jgi:hypothetical protein
MPHSDVSVDPESKSKVFSISPEAEDLPKRRRWREREKEERR